MMRKTLTILSLTGLLLSVGLWGASFWAATLVTPWANAVAHAGVMYLWVSELSTELENGVLPSPPGIHHLGGGWFVWCNDYQGFGTHWGRHAFAFPSTRLPELRFPLWLPTLFFGVWPAWQLLPIHRRRRRRKLGLCVQCGYDLRGSAGRCPECGTEFESSAGDGGG